MRCAAVCTGYARDTRPVPDKVRDLSCTNLKETKHRRNFSRRFDDGFAERACRLVDLSAGGVRLRVDTPADVASYFSLLLTRDAVPGRRCRIKWRKGSEIGAEFVGSRK